MRTKLGRQAKAVTAQDIETELAEVCEMAKRYAEEGNEKAYDEAHKWLDDCLSSWECARMMMPR